MKIEEFKGIVLSATDYSEASKILNVLTDKFGVIGIMAKGAKKVKSKFSSVSNPLIYGTFNVYYKENKLSTLISVDVIDIFENIHKDLTKITYSNYLLDLFIQTSRQDNNCELFGLLRDALVKINKNINSKVITQIVEIKLLDYLGVSPKIDSCSLCGSSDNIVTLSSYSGGYICKNCFSDEKIVNSKTIKIIRQYYYVDISKISDIDIDKNVIFEIDDFLDDYYDRYTGLYLKSRGFLKKLNL